MLSYVTPCCIPILGVLSVLERAARLLLMTTLFRRMRFLSDRSHYISSRFIARNRGEYDYKRLDFMQQRGSVRSKALIKMFTSLLTIALSVSVALAALPSGTVTCGSNKYSVSAIEAAINGGVKDLDSGNLPGACFWCWSLSLTLITILYRRLPASVL